MKSVHQQFIELLKDSAFKGEISVEKKDIIEHSFDESIFSITPEVVIYPTDTHDIQIAVQIINTLTHEHTPIHLTPRAAGTGLSGGSLNDSVVVNTTRHCNTIISHSKNDKGALVTLQPGVYYRDLETIMNQYDSYIPSFPASKDICTIGGMVGNNAAGPDTLQYGHTAGFVSSMKVVLHDGVEYDIHPLEWSVFEKELKRDDTLGSLYRYVWEQLLHNESAILDGRPKTQKNSAGYALWDVVSTTVEEFMKGRGTFDLGRLLTGSQGTLGIITEITMQAVTKPVDTHLVAVPIFDLSQAGVVIKNLLEHDPLNIELFDDETFKSALRHPSFFKTRLSGMRLFKMLFHLYWTFMVRFKMHIPEFTILVTFAGKKIDHEKLVTVCSALNNTHHCGAWIIKNKHEQEALWQIRRGSYMLSKYDCGCKRPAAFLEDMTVEPENLPGFFADIKKLFKKHNVEACIHGHGGNGHLHFYPLLDFTLPETPGRIIEMADEFFACAQKHGGNICGEHNDGIIRTPYLDMVFDESMLQRFADLEHTFDPQHIFNPGKKVDAKFDIKKSIRHSN